MKTSRPLAALALALVAVPLVFPFRVVVGHQPDGIVEIPIGPCFIASEPGTLKLLSAFMNRPISNVSEVQNYHKITSRIDYGRTVMAFIAAIIISPMIALFFQRKRRPYSAEAE